MDKKTVLFICVHNAARSQMAETFLNALAGDRFQAESAGLEPGELNQLVVIAMKEVGIDISNNKTKSVFDFYSRGKKFDYVITVCDASHAGKCPIFPGESKRLHWEFPDPASFQGSMDEKLVKTRQVRDQIKTQIELFIKKSRQV